MKKGWSALAVLAVVMLLASCGKVEPEAPAETETDTQPRTEPTVPAETEEPEIGTPEEPETEKSGITVETVSASNEAFYSLAFSEESEIFARIRGRSYKDECTLPLEDLRYIHVLVRDLAGETHEGEMVCNAYISDMLLEIFEELYEGGYPIEQMVLVDEYDADDEASMRDNNSSCFNFRFISHTTKISKHGLGMAVDINPLYNPYYKVVDGEEIVEPATAWEYLDRTRDFDYKIDENDPAYRLFTEKGFEWGGSWNGTKDYQHFEIPTDVIRDLYPENYPD